MQCRKYYFLGNIVLTGTFGLLLYMIVIRANLVTPIVVGLLIISACMNVVIILFSQCIILLHTSRVKSNIKHKQKYNYDTFIRTEPIDNPHEYNILENESNK